MQNAFDVGMYTLMQATIRGDIVVINVPLYAQKSLIKPRKLTNVVSDEISLHQIIRVCMPPICWTICMHGPERIAKTGLEQRENRAEAKRDFT